ncbi:MAG: molybdopterin/thiamine biosynthesis adenylyltransferase/molybdopterin synthase catalytic subunit [Candidatus Omnitrophota bacterium]|jgi:molybdopterin/thiamine biosynthesis adenylyltransferase/molybdopterin synthase catalytic subunit/rhodanese-related sulfurtransferase
MFTLSDQPINTQKLKSTLQSDQAGALCVFEGRVRNHNDNKSVASLEYEAHLPLCDNEVQKIFSEVKDKFNLLDLSSVHRVGHLQIGDMAVWVGVIAAHRADAFAACRYIVDEIKARLPIWKKEHYVDRASEWINCSADAQSKIQENLIKESHFYARQINLKEIGLEGQELLKQARVLVVGAGGLGSSALLGLAGAGVGMIGICEFDTLDVSNLHRQVLYTVDDVGRSKIDLAEMRIKALNPFITVNKHKSKLTCDNITVVLKDYEYVLDCTDNFPTKFLLNDACYFFNKFLVQASVYQYEGQITTYRADTPGCMRCVWPEVPKPGCVGSCAEAGVLGAVPSIFGSMQALEAVKLILNFDSALVNNTVMMNLLNFETRIIKSPASPTCPLCSSEPTITEIHTDNYSVKDKIMNISAKELKNLDLKKCVFVDIREPNEVMMDDVTEIDTVKLPLSKFTEGCFDFKSEKQYIIYCAAGVRSYNLVEHLHAQDIKNTISLDGGIHALHEFCESNNSEVS